MDRIREVRTNFTSLPFQHIYRELNMKADILSKEALRNKEARRVDEDNRSNKWKY